MEGFTEYKKEDAEKYISKRWWLGITIGDVLDKAADLYPGKEALVDDKCRLTYSQLREKVDKLAVGLIKLGIRKGHSVLLQLPNWGEFVYAFFALQKIGAIVVPLVPQHAQVEIKHFCHLTEARAWILAENYRKINYLPIVDEVLKTSPKLENIIFTRGKENTRFIHLERLIQDIVLNKEEISEIDKNRPDPMEVALILPTGGTTGLPKGVPRTHNSLICGIDYYTKAWEQNIKDICLIMGPVGHNQGLGPGVVGSILNFGKIVLLDSSRPEDFCRVVQEKKVTCVLMVPTLAQRIVNFKDLRNFDMTSLIKMSIGGAHCPSELFRSIRERIGCTCVSSFGSCEGIGIRTRLDDDFEIICSTVGRKVCPYDEYKIIDEDGNELPPNTEGELVGKGPRVFTGYFKSDNSEIFTKDGFFRTGDLARIDESGYITITGRIKDIIIRGGENISSIQIEELISSHPHVEYVAVIGMPDKELGEKVCAYIQPISGKQITAEEIISFLVSKGASKLLIPERIEFIDKIPLTRIGKTDKKTLREDIMKRLEIR